MTAKRDKAAPVSVFCLVFICRIALALVNVQGSSLKNIAGDNIISLVLSLGLTLAAALPAVMCCRKNKNPLDIKPLGYLYRAYFVFITALNTARFSYFASSVINPETNAWLFALLLSVCAFYCAVLGIEAISRTGAFVFVLMIIAVLIIIVFNSSEFDEVNLYPVLVNTNSDIFKNTLLFTANTSEIAVFLCLCRKVNGDSVKSFIQGLLASFTVMLVLIYFLLGSLGASASMYSYPFYTMFQISKLSNAGRPDVLHISFWIMAAFMKNTVTMYCALNSGEVKSKKPVGIITGALVLLGAVICCSGARITALFPKLIIIPFVLFCFVLPLLTLIFAKRGPSDEVIARF